MNSAESAASSASSGEAEQAATQRIATELERVVRRWQQLPLDRALSAAPLVRRLVQDLADLAAQEDGVLVEPVPDLGPAVLMDQLRVMVFDYQSACLGLQSLASRLTEIRRSLP